MQMVMCLNFRVATHIRILRGGARNGRAISDDLLLHVGPEDFASLKKALRVVGIPIPFRCMCNGNYAIEFWREDRLLTTVAYHHHHSLRHPLFPGDARLWNTSGLANWLAERGVTDLIEDLEQRKQLERRR